MNETIKATSLLHYVWWRFQEWKEEVETFGRDDPYVKEHLHGLLDMRIMAENLIGEPINLGLDGRMTYGFDEKEYNWGAA